MRGHSVARQQILGSNWPLHLGEQLRRDTTLLKQGNHFKNFYDKENVNICKEQTLTSDIRNLASKKIMS